MIDSAGQLGAGALTPIVKGVMPGIATAEVRPLDVRSHGRVSQLGGIVGTWTASVCVGLGPTLDLAAHTAGRIATLSFRPKYLRPGFPWPAESLGSWEAESVGSADLCNQDSFRVGSFARETNVRSASELNTLPAVPARVEVVREVQTALTPTPYVSVIWSLVQAQQLGKARGLLELIPDAPEYARLKRLLRTPVASVSQRKDFDRSAEYKWLTENARSYSGKWVAVSGDSLIAAAKTLRELRQEVKKLSPARTPLIYHVE
jgi:hypothetical protein